MSSGTRLVGRAHLLKTVATVGWALIPILTLGMATAPMMVHAAVRKRSLWQGATAVLYVVTICVMLMFDPDDSVRNDRIFSAGMVVNMAVGVAHAFAIRAWVWDLLPADSRRAKTLSLRARQQAALAEQRDVREAREAALAIVADDPYQALDLKIGRADKGRRGFPDGGLVDVNHVPAGTIARTTGLAESTARQIVKAREEVGGFSSVADLSITMDLHPRALDAVADQLIFLPLSAPRRSR